MGFILLGNRRNRRSRHLLHQRIIQALIQPLHLQPVKEPVKASCLMEIIINYSTTQVSPRQTPSLKEENLPIFSSHHVSIIPCIKCLLTLLLS